MFCLRFNSPADTSVRLFPIKKKALRHRLKIFTTNNHYVWSKLPVVPEMPCLINIVVQKFIIAQQVIVIVQIILGNEPFG